MALFESSGTISLEGVFSNANTLARDIANTQPDVVLMDIRMPGLSGIEAIKQIREINPQIKVVMQTVFDNDEMIFSAICSGANGYILKSSSSETYHQSVEDAYLGGAPMSPSIAAKVLRMFQQQNKQVTTTGYGLSEKEYEVLRGLVAGKSYKMIAADMSIAYPTVRFHMKNIYDKLHVQSMTEAVAKAILEGVVRPPVN